MATYVQAIRKVFDGVIPGETINETAIAAHRANYTLFQFNGNIVLLVVNQNNHEITTYRTSLTMIDLQVN